MISFKFPKNRGFTLVEIVLVVAIFLVLLASSASLLSSNTFLNSLKAKAAEVASLIGRARNNALTGFLSDNWGIKVLDNNVDCANNGASSGDCVVMFKGNNYSTRNANYDKKVYLENGFHLDSTDQNDFYFVYDSGWLSSSTVGNLPEQATIIKNTSGATQTVTTTPFGLVYYGD